MTTSAPASTAQQALAFSGISMMEVFTVALFTPSPEGMHDGKVCWGLPVLFQGGSGVAKSALVKQVAEAWGLYMYRLSPGEHGDGAFGVVPTITGDNRIADRVRITYAKPAWMDDFEEAERGLLFVDEINTGLSHLYAPALAMVHDRRVAGYRMPAGVRVVGAMNPAAAAANGSDLPPSVANRLGHFQWGVPNKRHWNNFMLSRTAPQVSNVANTGTQSEVEEARVLAAWPKAYAAAAAMVNVFTDRKMDLWVSQPNSDDPRASGAWPSLRTWDMAAHALASASIHGLSDTATDALLTGFIGAEATTELVTFKRALDLPDPEALLDGAQGTAPFQFEAMRMDRTYAILQSCAAFLVSGGEPKPGSAEALLREGRALKMWDMAQACLTAGNPDIAMDSVLALSKAKLARGNPNLEKRSTPVLATMYPIMQAAGIRL